MIEYQPNPRPAVADSDQQATQVLPAGIERGVDVIVEEALRVGGVNFGKLANSKRNFGRFPGFPVGGKIGPVAGDPAVDQRDSLRDLVQRRPQIGFIDSALDIEDGLRKPSKADGVFGAVIECPDDPVDSRQISSVCGIGEGKAQEAAPREDHRRQVDDRLGVIRLKALLHEVDAEPFLDGQQQRDEAEGIHPKGRQVRLRGDAAGLERHERLNLGAELLLNSLGGKGLWHYWVLPVRLIRIEADELDDVLKVMAVSNVESGDVKREQGAEGLEGGI